MDATFFATPADFRAWFEQNHHKEQELLVGFYKKGSGKPSITWPESVDQALCFGWIDGVRRSLGEDSYTIRFTPRKPRSIWSAVNVKRVGELTEQALMHPAGLKAFEARSQEKTELYAYEQKNVALTPDYERQFKANPQAWENFQTMPPSYRKTAIWWVVSAKREETRLKRLATLIDDSEHGRKIRELTPPAERKQAK